MRCSPDILAKIVYSMAGNEGRLVYVERRASPRDALQIPVAGDGSPVIMLPPEAVFWVVMPLQPLRVMRRSGRVDLTMGRGALPDGWLQPIGDDPAGRSDCEADRIDVNSLSWG